jgi:hypothetical protein
MLSFVGAARQYFKCNNIAPLESIPVLTSPGDSDKAATHTQGEIVSKVMVPGGGSPMIARGPTMALTNRGPITYPTG